jgi:hypothetical protein
VFVEARNLMLGIDEDGIPIKDGVALEGVILRLYVRAPQAPAVESDTVKEIAVVAPLPIDVNSPFTLLRSITRPEFDGVEQVMYT